MCYFGRVDCVQTSFRIWMLEAILHKQSTVMLHIASFDEVADVEMMNRDRNCMAT